MPFIASLLTTLIAILVYLSSTKIPNKQNRLAVRAIAILIAAVAAFVALFKNLAVIPAGKVGVIELFGRVSERPLNPGIHFINPFASVEEYSTRLMDIKETVEATSSEGLAFNIDVSIQYRLAPDKAVAVYQIVGTDETEIIISRFRSVIREITASYPAEAIYSVKRQEVAAKLRQRLSEQLTPLGFSIEETLLREITLPETLQAAIQEKLKTEQESQAMKFVLEKERQEAERKRIEAKGVADSQKIVSEGLNERILQLRAIEATEKLAGSNNAKVIVVGGNQGGVPVMFQFDETTSASQN